MKQALMTLKIWPRIDTIRDFGDFRYSRDVFIFYILNGVDLCILIKGVYDTQFSNRELIVTLREEYQ